MPARIPTHQTATKRATRRASAQHWRADQSRLRNALRGIPEPQRSDTITRLRDGASIFEAILIPDMVNAVMAELAQTRKARK